MALGKDTDRVFKIGGGILYLKEMPSGSFTEIGYLGGTKIVEKVDSEKVYDETGKHVGSFNGNRDVTLESTLLQSAVDEIDLLKDSADKIYMARYQVLREDGNYHLFSFFNCKIIRDFEINFDNTPRRLPLRLDVMYSDDEDYLDYWDHKEVAAAPEDDDWPDYVAPA